MKFTYTAFDKSGKRTSGIAEAATAAEAGESLRREGLYVTSIETSEHAAKAGRTVRGGRPRSRLKHMVSFSRQLQVLISSGVPLVQALGAVERQSADVHWRQVVMRLRERVEEGVPMSEAMADFPGHFDTVSRSLVAAGESSGDLAAMLDRLALLSRKQLQLRNSIIGAMVYPIVLIALGVNVLIGMLLFVLPRFVDLFATLDAPLPPTTRALMVASTTLREYWWGLLIGAIAGTVGLRYWLASESGRRTVQGLLIRLPKFGQLIKSIILARMARLLGTLIESHVPLLDALALARQASTHYRYADLMTAAEDAVSRGEPISNAFADADLVSPSFHEAMRSGEQSGRIGVLLLQFAEFMDDENDIVVKSLTSLLEPLIMVVLGGIVAGIAISMFMPLFDLAGMASGGGP
jgi:type II secretory pathway component PulF